MFIKAIGYLSNFADDACKLMLQKNVCDGAINEFARNLIISLFTGKLNSAYICGRMNFCEVKYKVLEFEDFAKEVLADLPTSVELPVPTMNQTFKVLHISDIHIDENYEEKANMNCNEPLCCRSVSSLSNKTSDEAGYLIL